MSKSLNQPLLLVEGLGKTVRSHASDTSSSATDDKLVILQNIDLQIQRGDTLAIVGPSGSGKSTLLGLLAGLDMPSHGAIFLNGKNIVQLNEDERAALRGENIGFVFQSFQLLPSFTALENVILPLELQENSGSFADVQKQARQLLARVGLSDREQHYPNQLSGGEQQRVAIARAFITKPLLLFADEPTGNLDARTGQQVIDFMFELNQEHATTLVLVTHDHMLANRCARVLELQEGQISAVTETEHS
jgi:putative ABC transport system ATP-binding protein